MQRKQVTIQAINKSNWYACCQLKISDAQQAFLEPNAMSILQAQFEQTLHPYGIYEDDEMVGFVMYNTALEELDGYWIYRIMIDEQFQGQGIAKKAVELVIEKIKALPNARRVVVGYHPENEAAHNLYKSLGFIDEGARFGKEMAVLKQLNL